MMSSAVNIRGVRDATLVSNFFTVGKVIPIVLFICVGAFFIDTQNFSFSTAPAYGNFSSSVLMLIYAFTGFEMAAIPAGGVSGPPHARPGGRLGWGCRVAAVRCAGRRVV